MTIEGHWPQVGDTAVELTESRYSYDKDRAGPTTTVQRITKTMLVTSDGKRYNRETLRPVSEGRYSDRRLVPDTDPRVLTARGREHLATLAALTQNLARLGYTTPEDTVAALAQIVTAADESRRAILALMREASRAEQASSR